MQPTLAWWDLSGMDYDLTACVDTPNIFFTLSHGNKKNMMYICN